jgi:hypothetical protein
MLLANHGLALRCPMAFEAWMERNERDEVAEKAYMKAREMEAKESLLSQDMPKLRILLLPIATCVAVETFQ